MHLVLWKNRYKKPRTASVVALGVFRSIHDMKADNFLEIKQKHNQNAETWNCGWHHYPQGEKHHQAVSNFKTIRRK